MRSARSERSSRSTDIGGVLPDGARALEPSSESECLKATRRGINEHVAKGAYDGALDAAVGRVVRARREERDWTQRQLAEAAGLHANVVGTIERGGASPRLRTLALLAGALDCVPSELLVLAEESVS